MEYEVTWGTDFLGQKVNAQLSTEMTRRFSESKTETMDTTVYYTCGDPLLPTVQNRLW